MLGLGELGDEAGGDERRGGALDGADRQAAELRELGLRGAGDAPVAVGELVALLAAESDEREIQRQRSERRPSGVAVGAQGAERGP